jgi:hypothetical protein
MRVSKLKRKRDRQRKRHEQRPQRVAPISPITGEVQATFSNTDAFGSSPLFNGIVDQRNPTSAGIARPHRSNRRIPTVLGSEEQRWPVGLLIATSPT